MTPDLVLGVHLHPRDAQGRLIFESPGGPVPDAREQVRRQCYRNGITDPGVVDTLYGEWRAGQRRAAADAGQPAADAGVAAEPAPPAGP